jgi:hypothetical protein
VTGLATPAYAADNVDLQVSIGDVTFGAGSTVVLHSFTVTNAGTADATGLTVTIDLLSDTPTPALTFSGQINGCTLVNPSQISCPLADLAAAGTRSTDFVAAAIEANPAPGSGSPVPMPMKVKVTVTANQADLNPADNTVTSAAIQRTVHGGATDLVAAAQPFDPAGIVGNTLAVQVGFANRGPGLSPVGETILTFTAPSGTQLDPSQFDSCFPVVPHVTVRCTSSGDNPPDQSPIQFFTARFIVTGGPIGLGEFRVEAMGGETNPADNAAKIAAVATTPTTPPTTAPAPGTPSSGAAAPLPVTGTKIGLITSLGAVAILLGVGLVLLGRRRRLRSDAREL